MQRQNAGANAHPEIVSTAAPTLATATAARPAYRGHHRPEPDVNLTGPDQTWRKLAACRGLDVNMFIPEGTGTGQLLYSQARQVCAGCPVRKACLDYALANREELGMWGGTTPQERKGIGYGPGVIVCGTCSKRVLRSSTNQKYCSKACGLTAWST